MDDTVKIPLYFGLLAAYTIAQYLILVHKYGVGKTAGLISAWVTAGIIALALFMINK